MTFPKHLEDATQKLIVGLLKKAASGVPWLCRNGSPDLGSAFCRAHVL